MSFLDLNKFTGKCLDGVVREFEVSEENIAKCGMIVLLKVIKDTEFAKTIEGIPSDMLEYSEKLHESAKMILEHVYSDYEIRIVNERLKK